MDLIPATSAIPGAPAVRALPTAHTLHFGRLSGDTYEYSMYRIGGTAGRLKHRGDGSNIESKLKPFANQYATALMAQDPNIYAFETLMYTIGLLPLVVEQDETNHKQSIVTKVETQLPDAMVNLAEYVFTHTMHPGLSALTSGTAYLLLKEASNYLAEQGQLGDGLEISRDALIERLHSTRKLNATLENNLLSHKKQKKNTPQPFHNRMLDDLETDLKQLPASATLAQVLDCTSAHLKRWMLETNAATLKLVGQYDSQYVAEGHELVDIYYWLFALKSSFEDGPVHLRLKESDRYGYGSSSRDRVSDTRLKTVMDTARSDENADPLDFEPIEAKMLREFLSETEAVDTYPREMEHTLMVVRSKLSNDARELMKTRPDILERIAKKIDARFAFLKSFKNLEGSVSNVLNMIFRGGAMVEMASAGTLGGLPMERREIPEIGWQEPRLMHMRRIWENAGYSTDHYGRVKGLEMDEWTNNEYWRLRHKFDAEEKARKEAAAKAADGTSTTT